MRFFLLTVAVVLLTTPAWAAPKVLMGSVESELVPSPVEYAVLLPDGYDSAQEPFPLLYSLHGGGGDRNTLATRLRPIFEEAWSKGVGPMVVVTPSVTKRTFYVDFRDGSEKWETFLVGEFLEHMREKFNVRTDREGTWLTGISMGGMGSLRMAFKYPDKFGAVAAMEPGIEPLLKFSDMRPKHRFWRSDQIFERVYGSPVDHDYYAANNPASIADAHSERLRESGLKIYLEAGDEDMYWLYEGTEFLHQVLWNNKIPHEYHLVHRADHTGPTLRPRLIETLGFFQRAFDRTPLDERHKAARARLEAMKAGLKERGHYEVD